MRTSLTHAEKSFLYRVILEGERILKRDSSSADLTQTTGKKDRFHSFDNLDDILEPEQLQHGNSQYTCLRANSPGEEKWVVFKKKMKTRSISDDMSIGRGQCSRAYEGYVFSSQHPSWERVAILEAHTIAINFAVSIKAIGIWQELYPASTTLLLDNTKQNKDSLFSYFILPFLGQDNLDAHLFDPHPSAAKNDASFPLRDAIKINLSIIKNLHEIHRRGYGHFDIKSSNIRVNLESHQCQFVDFERSEKVIMGSTALQHESNECFSTELLPPEARYDQKSDIFALAAVLSRVLSVYPYFSRERLLKAGGIINHEKISHTPFDLDTVARAITNDPAFREIDELLKKSGHKNHHFPVIIESFLKQMSCMNPAYRPDINQCELFFNMLNELIKYTLKLEYDLNNIYNMYNQLEELNRIKCALKVHEIVSAENDALYQAALKSPEKFFESHKKLNRVSLQLDSIEQSLYKKHKHTEKLKLLKESFPKFKRDCKQTVMIHLMAESSDQITEKLESSLDAHKQALIKKTALNIHRHNAIIRTLTIACRIVLTICTVGMFALCRGQSIFCGKTSSAFILSNKVNEVSKIHAI